MKTLFTVVISVFVLLSSTVKLFSQNTQPIVVASGLTLGVTDFDFHNQNIYFTTTDGPQIISKINRCQRAFFGSIYN